MKRWSIPITIVEHHRLAFVDADTRQEAIAKVRAAEWDGDCGLGDAERFTIKIVGKCVEINEEAS